ncbi:unnamed protein product [Linum tenue]|uniref:Uncharacterized protein n=1 Tax=Linum tenue TaxID=586396 RepID=A0AAV0RN18_9ROSI|nr:unnamed protein product [Linum tenue]
MGSGCGWGHSTARRPRR